MEVDDYKIGKGEKPLIIAEAGTNFGGDITLAKRFIEEASAAGADAVKFQTHVRDAEMAERPMRELGYGDLYERIERQELDKSEHAELKSHCNGHSVLFISTPYSVEGVRLLDELGVPAFKIGSGELTNYHLLKHAAETGKPLLISTGMADMGTVSQSIEFVDQHAEEYVVLYCVSVYPTDPADFNLGLLERMRSDFGVPVGFSDHSEGNEIAKIAIARGADVVEVHFTLSKNLPWGDQEVSVEPDQLREICNFAELYTKTKGLKKDMLEEEKEVKKWASHSLVTKKDLDEEEKMTRKNTTTKRPGTGIPASEYYEKLGSKIKEAVEQDQAILKNDIE